MVRMLAFRIVISILVIAESRLDGVLAQQEYHMTQDTDPGFSCSGLNKTCSAYLYYRAQNNYREVVSIAALLNAQSDSIRNLSQISSNTEQLSLGQGLLVPISCGCMGQISQSNVSYLIKDRDTFSSLYTTDFESLTSILMIENANPSANVTSLEIGERIVVPLRCACPTSQQVSTGTTSLLTYTIASEDSVTAVASNFEVDAADVYTANNLTATDLIYAATTILIPITGTPQLPLSPSTPSTSSPPSSPPSSSPPTSPPPSSSSGKNNTGVYAGIGAGVCAAILILAATLAFVYCYRKRRRAAAIKREYEPASGKGSAIIESSTEVGSVGSQRTFLPGDPLAGTHDLVGSDRPVVFSYDELMEATNKFGSGSKIEGSVYRGILKGRVVAVKQMKKIMTQELQILCQVHHTNLIKLVGLCSEGEHSYLVYEYAENGSLSDCLHTDVMIKSKMSTRSTSFLAWTTRVQIALDVATGLEYLHDYVNPSYVHKDVKSSNILLDSDFHAKIANFGMAKSAENNAMLTRHIAGTYGYMAPEYLAHGLVTTKADVYALGVVLLELLSGKEAILDDPADRGQERVLSSMIGPILDAENSLERLNLWMDPRMQKNYPLDTAKNFAQLARSCLDNDPARRPSMKDITYSLNHLVNASLEWESSAVFAEALHENPLEAR